MLQQECSNCGYSTDSYESSCPKCGSDLSGSVAGSLKEGLAMMRVFLFFKNETYLGGFLVLIGAFAVWVSSYIILLNWLGPGPEAVIQPGSEAAITRRNLSGMASVVLGIYFAVMHIRGRGGAVWQTFILVPFVPLIGLVSYTTILSGGILENGVLPSSPNPVSHRVFLGDELLHLLIAILPSIIVWIIIFSVWKRIIGEEAYREWEEQNVYEFKRN